MSTMRTIQYPLYLFIAVMLAACAGTPPTQEMSDARQAVNEAKESGAGSVVPGMLQSAEKQLKVAEKELSEKSYRDARDAAQTAKKEASMARKVAAAFTDAKAAMKNAKEVDYIWRDTGKIYKKAEKAAADGDAAKAIKLANQARVQAENAVNQYYLEAAEYIVRSMEQKGKLSNSQMSQIKAIQEAMSKKDGRKAYSIASKL